MPKGNSKFFILTAFLLLFTMLPSYAFAASERIFKIGEDAIVERDMHVRSVCVVNGQATIFGQVDGNVVAINGSVVLTRKAVVRGNVLSLGGVVVMARGAVVEGSVTEINSAHISEIITKILSNEWEGWSWLAAVFSLAVFFCTLVVGVITVALIPGPIVRISQTIAGQFWKSTAVGVLTLILIVPVAVLLTISVIGIVLIPLEVLIVTCAAFMGLIAISHLIGDKFYLLCRKSSPGPVGRVIWGLILIWLIGWIPVIGWMLKVFLITIGMGSTIFTRFGMLLPAKDTA